MKAVRIFGPIGDTSGYGNAVRNFCEAFALSGTLTSFHFSKKNMKYIQHLSNYIGNTHIDFYFHAPPYNRHKSSNYRIAYFYWEADCLPKYWSNSINIVDEIWAPCKLVKEACIKAGFNGKIKIVPTPAKKFNLSNNLGIPAPFSNDFILSDNVFKFYSIFQWHERKGFKELLRAYLSEFTANDNVVLILKVNPLNIGNYTVDKISEDILKIKKYLNKKNYPLVYLSKVIVSESQIYALHSIGDCYVSAHHGEGWGMPIHDAMLAGNQVITTKFGGVTEYLSKESAHLIDFDLKPVRDMNWSPLYGEYQKWAYPRVGHLSELMRDVFQNHKKYKYKAENAQKIALDLTIEPVSKIIRKELK